MSPATLSSDAPTSLFVDLAECLRWHEPFQGLERAVRLVGDRRAVLGRWAADVIERGALDEVAEGSSWHHNGFAKIVVHRGAEPDFRLRLHVWPAATGRTLRRGESDPHNHRWAFASTVLAGDGLDVDHFVAVDGADPSHLHYLVGPGIAGLREVGPVRLVRSQRLVRSVGDLYVCGTSVVHTVEPRGPHPVVTAVLSRLPTVGTSSVFRAPGDAGDPGGRAIRPDELVAALAQVAVLDAAPTGEAARA